MRDTRAESLLLFMQRYRLLDAVSGAEVFDVLADIFTLLETICDDILNVCLGDCDWNKEY